MNSQLKIGVDGGGTSTRAVVLTETLQVLGRGQAGSSNHYSVGVERAVENIEIAVEAALENAGASFSDVIFFGLGLAGACTATEQRTLSTALASFAQNTVLVVDEDAAAAQAGAFGGEPGVVCIAGTGANCFGVNAQGERARADGLGPLLGDRGSGYRIGEAALRAVCKSHDGGAPCPSLTKGVLAHFEISSIDELVQLVYRPDFARDRMAALFPIVLQANEEVSDEILRGAGQELAATATAVLRRLDLKRVAVSGGVLNKNTPVRQSFEAVLRREIADIEISESLHDAEIGAALLAPKLA